MLQTSQLLGEAGGVEIILDSINENETGEESRTDSHVNGKSGSILLLSVLTRVFSVSLMFST